MIEASRKQRSSRPALVLVLPPGVAALMLLAMWFIGRPSGAVLGFPLDDAWIHMVYGQGLLRDGFLSYNPGIPATGCTSPLWAAFTALAHVVVPAGSVDAIVAAVLLIGAGLHLVCVLAVTDLVLGLNRGRMTALVAGLLVALSPPLAAASLSGMEVALCASLLAVAIWACVREAWNTAGLALALAACTRPETALVSVGCAVLAMFAGDARWQARVWRVLRMAFPSLVLGLLLATFYWSASGRPLPATFFFKQAISVADLPNRFWIAVTSMLNEVAPFVGVVAWLALLGYVSRSMSWRVIFPLWAGVGFLGANLLLIDPSDPQAFYHLRYLLPAVPMLTVATAVGATGLGSRLPERLRSVPLLLLLVVGISGALATALQVSRHLHNDVRNINEVQRQMGEWLAARVPAGQWIAASDGGAVRYFSGRPTVDVMGLNTPGLYWDTERFVRDHPVAALAIMPAWFHVLNHPEGVQIYEAMETHDYTVTSDTNMARQLIIGCQGDRPRRIRFDGSRKFGLDCLPEMLGSASAYSPAPRP